MSTPIKYMSLPKDRRILVISDIHGNLPYLKGALSKVGFCDEDILIIDGDFLEKGSQSLDTLHYVMELSEKGNTFVLRGNCDGWHQILTWGDDVAAFVPKYMATRPDSLLRQMCRKVGLEPDENTAVADVRELLRENFPREMEFLAQMPIILETPNYTFVHGGVSAPTVEEANPYKCMKNDNFLGQGLSFNKWQIVGHWPVVLYREDITDAKPIICRDRKIISIDGGCVLKDDGQLNVLIIPYDGSEDFQYDWYDPFPVATALDDQEGSRESYYIRWGDNHVEILEEQGEFTRCRHERTGYEMDILTCFLRITGEAITANDCTDYILPVKAGDQLSIVRETSKGYLCKKNGVSGWYFGKIKGPLV